MEIKTITLTRIIAHERNLRRDLGDLTELADSIAAHGLLQPVVVAPVLVENLQRTDLSPVEEARGYEQLTLAGYDVSRIAKATGRSSSTVRHRLELVRLPEEMQDRVHDRQLTLTHAEAMAEFVDDPVAIDRLANAATASLTWEIEHQRRYRELREAAEELLSEAVARGVRVFRPGDQTPATAQSVRWLQALPWERRSEEAHEADCEHHALELRHTGVIEPLCLQPDAHGDADQPADAGDTALEEERARKEAERREFVEACEVAGKVRGDWLRTWIRAQKLTSQQVATVMSAMARTLVESYIEPSIPGELASWLGVASDDAEEDSALGELNAWLDSASTTPTHQHSPAKALVAILADHWEPIDPWTWDRPRELARLRPWFDLLDKLGYQLSDWEREQIDAAVAAAEGGGDG